MWCVFAGHALAIYFGAAFMLEAQGEVARVIEGDTPSDLPVFAHGYSFGGMLVLRALLDDPSCCQGAVLHAPLVRVAESSRVHPAVVSAAKVRNSALPWPCMATRRTG